jgi:hypothetical protein
MESLSSSFLSIFLCRTLRLLLLRFECKIGIRWRHCIDKLFLNNLGRPRRHRQSARAYLADIVRQSGKRTVDEKIPELPSNRCMRGTLSLQLSKQGREVVGNPCQ